jgi:ABC-type uncharacterized transport system permease subunit
MTQPDRTRAIAKMTAECDQNKAALVDMILADRAIGLALSIEIEMMELGTPGQRVLGAVAALVLVEVCRAIEERKREFT